ncbi:hypothetical protein PMAYCL1PPCAC_23072, partial [Pristionchus mayeri]
MRQSSIPRLNSDVEICECTSESVGKFYCRRYLSGGSEVTTLHEGSEHHEDLHSSQIFALNSAFANREGIDSRVLNELSLVVNVSLRAEV